MLAGVRHRGVALAAAGRAALPGSGRRPGGLRLRGRLHARRRVAQAERIIDAIEAQTKAEVVGLHAGPGRDDITTEEAEADAAALMDQWGVGRAGVNDGLVILFDLDTTLKHGQVQLYAGLRVRRAVPHARRAPGDLRRGRCCRCSRAATSTRRCWSALGEGRDRRRSTRRRPGHRPAAASRRSTRRRPARRSRPPRPTGRSTTTPASCRRRRSSRPRPRSTRSRRGPAPRSSSTPQDSGDYPTTEETEAKARALIDQWGVGREGLQRRDGHLLRHAAEPRARPGPAVRRARLRGGLPLEPGAPVDLRQRHAPAPPGRPTSTAR